MKSFLKLATRPGRRGRSGCILRAAAALLVTTLLAGCGAGSDETPTIYDVTVSVDSATDLNSLHFTLFSYFNDGDWIGHGEDLECTVLVDATMTSKHYGDGSLEIWLDHPDSFASPGEVLRCALKTSETLRDTSFDSKFHDATNFTGVNTAGSVAITDISSRP